MDDEVDWDGLLVVTDDVEVDGLVVVVDDVVVVDEPREAICAR